MLTGSGQRAIDSVLIVDDSAVQRSFAAALCGELGIGRVHEAGNGQEALALLEACTAPPELLIIDLEMPTMDGLELLGRLSERGIRAPVIIASSRERALVHSVQNLGFALGLHLLGTLQKPLTREKLGTLLRARPDATAGPKPAAQSQPIDPDALRAGLERNEIVVHYQPQVELETGYVRGVEALARWQHPAFGLVLPDQFIPVAEQHGLIHQLTLLVLNQALIQTALWNADGLDLTVGVNISPLLLEHADLVQEISDLQQCHGVPPDHVVLEVTESSLMRNLGVGLGVLTRLRLRGFGLSLDDYGTGFSSLLKLARVPFTELKVDRAFVHGAHARDGLKAILRSALDLAGRLEIDTVAEGVETWEDWRMLQSYGCRWAQGWLLGRAMPGEQFEGWVKSHLERRHEFRARTGADASR